MQYLKAGIGHFSPTRQLIIALLQSELILAVFLPELSNAKINGELETTEMSFPLTFLPMQCETF